VVTDIDGTLGHRDNIPEEVVRPAWASGRRMVIVVATGRIWPAPGGI
jgi:hydroxymethylpyrimidine pyrophosphatase-like HAD family hydrolase